MLHIAYGGVHLPWSDVMSVFAGDGGRLETIIVWKLRIPRAMSALIAGASMGMAGYILQTTLRNPLASPELAGVTMGGAFAVVLTIAFFPAIGAIYHPMIALIGGLVASAFVLSISLNEKFGHLGMILAGVAISAFCAGGVMLILTALAPSSLPASQWLVGSLAGRGNSQFFVMLPWSLLGFALIFIAKRPMVVLGLGDEAARSAGLNIVLWRSVLIFAAVSLTAGVVAIAGAVAFIGITAPHLAKMIITHDRKILITAPLFGAVLMVFADLFAKTLAAPREIPLALFLSFIGAPILIYLIRNSEKFNRQLSGSIS